MEMIGVLLFALIIIHGVVFLVVLLVIHLQHLLLVHVVENIFHPAFSACGIQDGGVVGEGAVGGREAPLAEVLLHLCLGHGLAVDHILRLFLSVVIHI